jgi:hypothetical protein
MRGIVVLFMLIFVLIIIPQVVSAGPRVSLGLDSRTGQRSVRLQGTPAYPTVDVTCDGQRRTIPLSRSDFAGRNIVASYGVPANTAETMLSAKECRLLIPGQDIRIARRQIRAAWPTSPKSAEAPKRGGVAQQQLTH